MNLNEIESATDALLEKLASTESAAEVRDLCFRLDGMYRGAQIKATVAYRKEQALPDLTLPQAPCGNASPGILVSGDIYAPQHCRWPVGHGGPHKSPQGVEWLNDSNPYPATAVSLVSDLREILTGWRAFARGLEDAGTRIGQDTSAAGCMATAGAYASQVESLLAGFH